MVTNPAGFQMHRQESGTSTDDFDDINFDRGFPTSAWLMGGVSIWVICALSASMFGWPFHWNASLAVCFFVVWCGLAYRASKRNAVNRSAALRLVAEKLGLNYASVAERESVPEIAGIKLFDECARLRAENLVTGTFLGQSIKLFDLHAWDQNRGEDGAWFSITVVAINGALPIPDFELQPLKLPTRLARVFMDSGIKVSGTMLRDQFSNQYDLRGTSENEIMALFDGSPVEYFARRPGWAVYSSNQWLLIWREGYGALDKLEARRHFQLASETRDGDRKLVAGNELMRLLERALYIRELFAEQCRVKSVMSAPERPGHGFDELSIPR